MIWKDRKIEVITPRPSKGERVIVFGCKIGTEIKMLLPNKEHDLECNIPNVKATVTEINDHFEEEKDNE